MKSTGKLDKTRKKYNYEEEGQSENESYDEEEAEVDMLSYQEIKKLDGVSKNMKKIKLNEYIIVNEDDLAFTPSIE